MSLRRSLPVLAAAIAFAGCGDDDPDRPSAAATVAPPATTTPAPTATTRPAKPTPATPRKTSTSPAPGKSSRKPVAPGGTNDGPTKTYSGDGSQALPLELERNAVLRWTVTGTRFRLTDRSAGLRITGGARGQTFAPAGKYPRARVTADGKWRLEVEVLAAP